jgi:hypothetical protein
MGPMGLKRWDKSIPPATTTGGRAPLVEGAPIGGAVVTRGAIKKSRISPIAQASKCADCRQDMPTCHDPADGKRRCWDCQDKQNQDRMRLRQTRFW